MRFEWQAVFGLSRWPRLTQGGASIGDGYDGVATPSGLTGPRATLNRAGEGARGAVPPPAPLCDMAAMAPEVWGVWPAPGEGGEPSQY